MSSIPRAVRERYKPDRRCSSHGWVGVSGPYWGWDAGLEVRPVPCPEPTGRTSCIPPSVVCVQQEAAACVESGGLRLLVRKSAPLLPPGSVNKSALYSPACTRLMACWGQKKQNQEEEHPACHATLPSSPTCGCRFHWGGV